MSNLVRQYYVVEQSSKARIINSNRKMELRLKELSEQNHKDDDGFVDGLVADIVETAGNEEDEAEAGSVLENAKSEADRILQRQIQVQRLFLKMPRTMQMSSLNRNAWRAIMMVLRKKKMS